MSEPIPSLKYAAASVAFLSPAGLTGRPGAGCGLLELSLSASTHGVGRNQNAGRVRVPLMAGCVEADTVGFVAAINPHCIDLHCRSDNPPSQFVLTAAVPMRVIEALDDARADGPVHFTWKVEAQVAGRQTTFTQDIVQCSRADVRVTVSPEEWNELVTAMGYEERVYLSGGVPIAGAGVPEVFTKAAALMKEAILRHRAGDWRGSVQRCRDVFDEIGVVTKTPLCQDSCCLG